MTSLLRAAFRGGREVERSIASVDDYIDAVSAYGFGYGGMDLTLGGLTGTMKGQAAERISNDLEGFARAAFAANGVVFACLAVRMAVFSTIRFQWQRINRGKPSELFGSFDLDPLETPWPGGTTQDLLSREIQHADLAGNAYNARVDNELVRLRPDWVLIACEPRMVRGVQVGWRRIGYVYFEGGIGVGEPAYFLLDEVSHFAPLPDPLASYRGMSWLTPVLREIQNDKAMGSHQSAFYENAAPQPLDARVLTPAGWSTMGAMSLGAEVIGSDGKPHRVTGVFPQGERDIYRVTFADGSAVECTDDHLWTVQNDYDRRRGVERTLPLRDLVAAGLQYPSGPSKWAVRFVDPVEFNDPGPLPVDPYLLGLLLGDGSFRSNGKGSGGVTLAADAQDAEHLSGLLPGLLPAGVTPIRRDRGGWSEFYLRGPGGTNPFTALIRGLGLWGVPGPEKFVPPAYMRGSVTERVALLQGLIDSDGSVDARQRNLVRFTNRSESLARAVGELARSLGGTASVIEVPAKRQWVTTIQRLPEWIVPCALPRKVARYQPPSARAFRWRHIADVRFVGRKPAQCIRVDTPDSLYVTDDYVLTHNTPNLSVSLDKEVRHEAFKKFRETMDTGHKGVRNAYKTLYLGGGADVKVIGQDFKAMDFSAVQGHGETRVAAAAGVPPVIVGLSEGLEAATYSNYAQARRRFADGTMHPLWQNVAGSLAPLIDKPSQGGDIRLWYDARDVPFLREDRKDAVMITQAQAGTIRQLIEAGYDPDSVVRAVTSEDFGLLIGQHSGLTSVQLQAPGADQVGAGTVQGRARLRATASRLLELGAEPASGQTNENHAEVGDPEENPDA